MFHNRWEKCLLLLCTVTILLSACSYKELEDSLKRKLNTDEDQYVNDTKIPHQDVETTEEEKKVYTIGDTVRYSFEVEEAGTYEYTLNDVQLSDNIHDAGLTNSDFIEQTGFDKDGNIDSENQLLTLDFTVKNINSEGKDPTAKVPIVPIQPTISFKSWIEDPDGPWQLYVDYFSHGIIEKDDPWKSYFYFPLDIGAQVDVKLGWFVPVDQLGTEPLYHILGNGGSPENYMYFELQLE